MGVINKLFGRLRVVSDSNVTTQTSSVIQADSGNTNLVIAPSGTGAIIASIPDGTATGGNARGAGAVDLQVSRYNAVHVASGANSVIGGGANSRATGQYSVVAGGNQGFATGLGSFVGSGFNNSSSGTESAIVGGNSNSNSGGYAFIGGGQTNLATGNHSVIAGGLNNTASVIYSAILGGNGNTASTGQYATIIGGTSNTSSGFATLAHGNQNTASGGIALGTSNTASGSPSFAVGSTNTASGNFSFTFGDQNIASNISSIAMGAKTRAYMQGQLSVSGFNLQNSAYDAQSTIFTLGRRSVLNSGATTTLSCDGTGTTNLLIPYIGPGSSNGRSWNVTIKYVAVVTAITGTATGVTVGDTKSQNIEIGFKRIGATSSLVGAGSYSIAQEDASMNSATLVPTAGGSQQLALTFTAPTFAGGGSVTCNVVAQVQVAETGW